MYAMKTIYFDEKPSLRCDPCSTNYILVRLFSN